MSEMVEVDFSSLDLKVGQTLQIVPDSANPKDLFESAFIGGVHSETLILTAPPSGIFPSINEGQMLVIRILLADGVAVFTTNVLFITEVPMFMVFLDYPEKVKFHKIRKAKRVNIEMPILITGLGEGRPRNVDGKIVDISISGAGLEVKDELADVSEAIQIRGKFKVGSIQRLLSIKAIVRAKKALGDGTFLYGVEFLEDNEDGLLVLFGFIFNAMAFGEIQEIR